MRERVFVDTNLFVYADDLDAGPKRERAQSVLDQVIRAQCAVVSTQVLQEFFVVATRKLGIPSALARQKVEWIARLDVVVVEPEHILGATDLHRLHSLSFWDALVVKCAAAARCARLLSEDLQTGATMDGVRIENPFLASWEG